MTENSMISSLEKLINTKFDGLYKQLEARQEFDANNIQLLRDKDAEQDARLNSHGKRLRVLEQDKVANEKIECQKKTSWTSKILESFIRWVVPTVMTALLTAILIILSTGKLPAEEILKYQTNEEFSEQMNDNFCQFFVILEKVEKVNGWNGTKFSNEQTNRVAKECISKNLIFRNGTVQRADLIFNVAAKELGCKKRCLKKVWATATYQPKKNEEEILCLKRDDWDGMHFVAGNNQAGHVLADEIEFDPIEGGSLCAKVGYIASKRILVISED